MFIPFLLDFGERVLINRNLGELRTLQRREIRFLRRHIDLGKGGVDSSKCESSAAMIDRAKLTVWSFSRIDVVV